MAQTGYTPIQLYYSSTTTNVPLAANLAAGELAINTADGKLFYKDSGGVVRVIAQTSSVTNVASISFGSTGLTPSTATTGAVTVAGTLATTNGGTGLTSFTANRVFYSSSTSAIGSSANLTFDGTTLTANALTTTSTVTINGGTANGVAYLNGSKVLTTGSALQFDGTNLGIGTTSPSARLDITGSDPGVQMAIRGWAMLSVGNPTALEFGGVNASQWQTIKFYTAGTERMRLDSSGNLGLGVTPPSTRATWNQFSVGASLNITADKTGVGGANFYHNAYDTGTSYYQNNGPAEYYQMYNGYHAWYIAPSGTAGNAISFTQAMTLDASGNLALGTTNSGYGKLGVYDASNALIGVANSTSYAQLQQNGADLYINWNISGASGGNLIFRSGATNTERARITSGGNFYIGTTTGGGPLQVKTSAGQWRIEAYSTGTKMVSVNSADNAEDILGVQGSTIAFLTGSTERARITSGGDLLVNTTTTAGIVTVDQRGSTGTGSVTSAYNHFHANTKYADFLWYGTTIGSITNVSGVAVAYNTTSDHRLKDNQQPLTGSGAFIDALKPKTWNWKTDGTKGVGFIAHEVQEVSPGSVVGTKDAVDEEGKPVYQAMEYGSAEFIANIIAELQSLRARVAQLEAK